MHEADQYQLLFPHRRLPIPALMSPPIESKKAAISWAVRFFVPRGSISIVRLPRPLVLASSSESPPRLNIWMATSGDVVMRLTSRMVPLGSSPRTICEAGCSSADLVVGALWRSRSSALGSPAAPTYSDGSRATVSSLVRSRYFFATRLSSTGVTSWIRAT